MISRVTAEFESPELAELALMRIKESVQSVYSAKLLPNKMHERAHRQGKGTSYSIIPTYCNTHTNFYTAVMEYPLSSDNIPEPARNRKTSACIVCEKEDVGNAVAIMNAMGGLNIRSAD
jgi:hypothetical protein